MMNFRPNPTVALLLGACLSIAAAGGADKKPGGFSPGRASDYPNRQTQGGVIVAARAYTTDEETRAPFGKLNPYKEGVLPVLVLIENRSQQTLRLEDIRVQYHDPERGKVNAVPASEVRFLRAPERPKFGTSPLPPIRRSKKNPLEAMEIEARAFAARMLPPGESADGFFYFQAAASPGAVLYVTGLREAQSGKELFYFDVPLNPAR